MSGPWSPSEAREALRAEFGTTLSDGSARTLLDACRPEATACDSAEAFAALWGLGWPRSELCQSLLARALEAIR